MHFCFQSAEKDMNPLVQECWELRKNLDVEKRRFKELNEEVKLLRRELESQVQKNEEDIGIVNSFKVWNIYQYTNKITLNIKQWYIQIKI